MKSVITEVNTEYTKKYSTDVSGYLRLVKEIGVYEYLKESIHIPRVIEKYLGDSALIKIETINGISLKQLLAKNDNKNPTPHKWNDAKVYLKQYVDAEMDLLHKGALYRDLNVDHVIFSNQVAYFIDLESTIIKDEHDEWTLNDMRGTWETMAPEEFRGFGKLDSRTATYRVAVVAHVLLTGELPFEQPLKTRARTRSRRMKHPAKISQVLDKNARRIFKSSLERNPVRRHKDPMSFFNKLNDAYIDQK
jgi:serine/threonine protein kinase